MLIKVQDQSKGTELTFKIKGTSSLSRLMTKYCEVTVRNFKRTF